MIIDCIYFNHYGFFICNQEKFKSLLNELVNSIKFCRNNRCDLIFYCNFYSIHLIFSNDNFIDYLYKDKEYYSHSVFIVDYLSKCKKYPVFNKVQIDLTDPSVFFNRFDTVCQLESPKAILSLSNDSQVSALINNRAICFLNNLDDLTLYVKNNIQFDSILEVFDYIKKRHLSEFDYIFNTVKHSCRQLSCDCETCRDIYKAVICLLEIVLPSGNNKLSDSIIKEYEKESKFEISGESQQTLNDRFCKEKREFFINGKKYLFENHVKIKSRKIRIHFYILKNVLYIGYCGKHLPTSTQST